MTAMRGNSDLGKAGRAYAARCRPLPDLGRRPVGDRAARDRDLPLSVRGGGHDWAVAPCATESLST